MEKKGPSNPRINPYTCSDCGDDDPKHGCRPR
jgi:hypothetical protein